MLKILSKSTPLNRFLYLIVPFILWLSINHWGAIGLNIDNFHYYHWIQYYYHYLIQGTIPIWDPFRSWGWPNQTETRIFGNFNPLYALIPVLKILGFNSMTAFNAFLITLYWVGLIGFYLLVISITENELTAFISYSILMFSCLGELLFSQLAIPLITFPSIWLIYFSISFFKSSSIEDQKKYFCGIILSLMIVLTTYLPFFCIIIIGSILATLFIFQPLTFFSSFQKLTSFIRKVHPSLLWMTIVLLTLSSLPGLTWYRDSKNGEALIIDSRNNFSTSQGSANTPLPLINQSGLTAKVCFSEIFSDLDLNMHEFSYLPIFVYIALSLGIFTPMSGVIRVAFISGFFIFLLSITNVTPIYSFFYHYVFIFKLFRNVYFLSSALMGFLTITAVSQFIIFLESRPVNFKDRVRYALYILIAHLLWTIFLSLQENIIWASFATVFFNCVLLISYTFGLMDNKPYLFIALLFLTIFLQPFKVLTNDYLVNGSVGTFEKEGPVPPFSYLRPLKGTDPDTEIGYHFSYQQIKDESGFYRLGYYGQANSFKLYSHILPEELQNYVHYKFIIYDQVFYMDDENPNWLVVKTPLIKLENLAWIHQQNALEGQPKKIPQIPSLATVVTGPSDLLTVEEFTPNTISIKTNFPSKKFLVYNDGFSSKWKAYVNGKKTQIFRTNIAFKGIWVESGPQKIKFIYENCFTYLLIWATSLFFILFGLYTISQLIRFKTNG